MITYKIKINGKEYALPARTLAVDERIEEISGLDAKYKAGELTRRGVVEALHAFVDGLAPGCVPPLEEVDTNELLKVSMDIIAAYDGPAQRAKVESQMSSARELLKNPEIQKLLAVVPMLNKK